MTGGISQYKSGVPPTLADSDGEANITVPTTGGQPSGLPNVAHFNDQRIFSDHVLDNPEQFYDDAPYVPPRVSQAELSYPALHPRGSSYGPTGCSVHHGQYSFEGGTSPSGSHDSIESSWSTSSSSASSRQVLQLGHTSQYSQLPQFPRGTSHYPAYHGKQRIGLEHTQYGEHASLLLSTQMTHYPSTHPQRYIPTTDQPSTISAASDSAPSVPSDTAAYLRVQLGLSAHENVSLHSLPDPPPGEKPSTPLPMLIKLAIYGSPRKQLTLQEIYTELENRFQWFRDHRHEQAWKNSIRHNLSLNKVFVHVPRPITEPGKGSYWRLDVSGGEGYKRTRKRRPRNKVVVSEEEGEASEVEDDRLSPIGLSQSAGPSRSSGTPTEDPNIDPELRSEGHVVGEGRTRSATRRLGGGSPYPQQSPRHQQVPLPGVAGQDTGAPGQPSIRFGQPSFGFPTYPPTQLVSLLDPSPMSMMATSPAARSQNMVSYDESVHGPRGIESVADLGELSPESSSSGSSRTWKARSRS